MSPQSSPPRQIGKVRLAATFMFFGYSVYRSDAPPKARDVMVSGTSSMSSLVTSGVERTHICLKTSRAGWGDVPGGVVQPEPRVKVGPLALGEHLTMSIRVELVDHHSIMAGEDPELVGG